MARIASLSTSLTLESQSFLSGLKKAVDASASSSKAIGGHLTDLKSAATALATGAVATAIVAAGKRALDYASSLDEVSQQLGVTSKDLQVYRYAASQVGISQDEMDTGLAKLTKTIGEAAAGVKAPVEAFKNLGVSLRDSNGNLLTAGDIIPRIADALSTIKDPATQAKVGLDLFGKAGQKLNPLLAGGSGAINELAKAAADLGIVLSVDQIENADKAADKLSELQQVLEAKIAGVVADNANAIYTFADALEHLVGKAGSVIDFLKELKLRIGIAQDSVAQYTLGRPEDRADASSRLLAERDALGNLQNPIKGGTRSGTGHVAGSPIYKPPLGSGGYETVNDGGAAAKKAAEEAEKQRQKALRQEDKFQSDKARSDDEFLGLRQQLTSDVREQAQYQHEQVDRDAAARDRDIDLAVQEKQITAAAGAELKALGDRVDTLKHGQINRELDAKLAQQQLDTTTAGIENQRDLLTAQEGLAKTAAERRDIELKLLALQYEEERARQNAILASKDSTDAQKKDAQAKLDALGELQPIAEAGVRQGTRGPGETYLDSLKKTSGEIGEELESGAVSALEKLNTELDDSVKKTLHLHGILGDIVGDFVDMAIKQALIKPLAQSLFGGSAGGSGGLFGGLLLKLGLGGPLSTAASAPLGFSGAGQIGLPTGNPFDLGTNIAGLANGGTIGGFGGIDRNLLSINGTPVARVGRGEMLRVEPNNDNGGRGSIAQIVPSPYFDVVVRRQAAGVAAPLASQAASAGSTGAQVAIMRRQSRSIP